MPEHTKCSKEKGALRLRKCRAYSTQQQPGRSRKGATQRARPANHTKVTLDEPDGVTACAICGTLTSRHAKHLCQTEYLLAKVHHLDIYRFDWLTPLCVSEIEGMREKALEQASGHIFTRLLTYTHTNIWFMQKETPWGGLSVPQ